MMQSNGYGSVRNNELFNIDLGSGADQRRRVYARFKVNIGAADLAQMGSLSSKNRSVKYLLCVIDVFTKYTFER